MNDIESRADIDKVVREFYHRVKNDTLLGPIFLEQIQDWEPHLLKIIAFWEQAIFMVRGQYYGSPMQAHVQVDRNANYKVSPKHFGQWLYHWVNVIKENYEGPNADRMMEQARKMQTALYIKIFENKLKHDSD